MVATPDDHPNLPIYLNILGYGLRRRFEQSGTVEDLEEAIRRAEQAVAATPVDHPEPATYLYSLGLGLQRRFERSKRMEDDTSALQSFRRAWDIANAVPINLLTAARSAIQIVKDHRD